MPSSAPDGANIHKISWQIGSCAKLAGPGRGAWPQKGGPEGQGSDRVRTLRVLGGVLGPKTGGPRLIWGLFQDPFGSLVGGTFGLLFGARSRTRFFAILKGWK